MRSGPLFSRIPFRRQAGQALPEFLLSGLLVLWLGSAIYETLQWRQEREVLYSALAEAARAGSRQQLDPQAMAQAFEAALRPLAARRAAALAAAGLPRWRLEVLQPAAAHYRLHGRTLPGLPAPAIRHDRQPEQHRLRPGPPTIFEANTLRLRLTYASSPATPWLAALLPALAALSTDPCRRALLAAGWLPQRLELTIEMQSHARRWPDTAGIFAQRLPCH